jgi:hypothetical protein
MYRGTVAYQTFKARQNGLFHYSLELRFSPWVSLKHKFNRCDSLEVSLGLEGSNETTSRAVVAAWSTRRVKLGLDLLSKDLAKLDTPLVEAVDAPDGTLSKGEVLVVDNQSTESTRGDLLCKDGGCWAVAEESLVSNQGLWGALSLELLWTLAKHESLSLGEEVRCEHLLVEVVFGWVVGFGSEDEISWDELGALVQELVEGVLGVGCWLAEEDWASSVVDHLALTVDGLTVRLHGELLKVSREAVEVLVESEIALVMLLSRIWSYLRRDEVSLSSVEVRVPDTQKTSDDWNVLLKWSLSEMLVHGICTSKELVEVVVTNVKRNAKTNSTPDTVSSSNPVLEAEHVLSVNTKLLNFLLVG